jgi:hypothetical protein
MAVINFIRKSVLNDVVILVQSRFVLLKTLQKCGLTLFYTSVLP